MPRALVYLRVSTDEQADARAGLNAQRDACAAWCGREGYAFVGPFEDVEGVSGTAPLDRRPALLDAVAALGPGDVLLVAKRDRLARDPMVVAMLEAAVKRKKARAVSAAGEGTDDDGPSSVLMRRMVDAFAEYERLIIGFRTSAALQAKRRRRERTGRVPYGSDVVDDGRRSKRGGLPVALVDRPDELRVLKRMVALSRAGWPGNRIAWLLNAQGLATKAGKAWRPGSVYFLLKRWTADPAALALLDATPDDYLAPTYQRQRPEGPGQAQGPPPEADRRPAP